jgi:hypothetical protein
MPFELTEKYVKKGVHGQGVRHLKYALLRKRGFTPTQARKKTGFSTSYKDKDILKHVDTANLVKSVQENRELLQQVPGLTFFDSMFTAEEIRDNKENHPDTQLRANKQIIEGMGYNAPELINIEERSLSINLNNMTTDELIKFVKDSAPT